MMVLHTAFNADVLVLWGEMPAAPDAHPVRRRGRKPREPRPQPLPFAAAAADLSRAAGAVCAGFTPAADQAVTRIAWLPTVGGVPLASSPLVAEPPGTAGTPGLAPWTVPALVLPPAQAIELLSAALERPALAPGILAGADLRYWATMPSAWPDWPRRCQECADRSRRIRRRARRRYRPPGSWLPSWAG